MVWAAAFPGMASGALIALLCHVKFGLWLWACVLIYPVVGTLITLILVVCLFLWEQRTASGYGPHNVKSLG